jgi:predicted nucleic acid-binding protein
LIYLDACAVVKAVNENEAHHAAITTFLRRHTAFVTVSSALVMVETRRSLTRIGATAPVWARGEKLLERLTLAPISPTVLDVASRLPGATLRSLDAIHLATALALAKQDVVTSFVTYDKRLLDAATAAGLPAIQPLDATPTAAHS